MFNTKHSFYRKTAEMRARQGSQNWKDRVDLFGHEGFEIFAETQSCEVYMQFGFVETDGWDKTNISNTRKTRHNPRR